MASNKCLGIVFLVMHMVLSSVCAWSQATDTDNAAIERRIQQGTEQITGLLLDNTKTKAGRDFYESMYRNWSAALLDSTENNLALILPTFTEEITIDFEEQPAMGNSTRIIMNVDNVPIWTQLLQPRASVIEMLSEYAVLVLTDYLTNYQEYIQELNNEDSKGTGVY
jgi:curli production assembly/transport component CsgE